RFCEPPLNLQIRNQLLGQTGSGPITTEISGQAAPGFGSCSDRFFYASSGLSLSDVVQHQYCRKRYRDRVGQSLSGKIRSAAMDRFEHCIPGSNVRSRHKPESSNQASAQVADHVAEEI